MSSEAPWLGTQEPPYGARIDALQRMKGTISSLRHAEMLEHVAYGDFVDEHCAGGAQRAGV
jgi:hypothetical protein